MIYNIYTSDILANHIQSLFDTIHQESCSIFNDIGYNYKLIEVNSITEFGKTIAEKIVQIINTIISTIKKILSRIASEKVLEKIKNTIDTINNRDKYVNEAKSRSNPKKIKTNIRYSVIPKGQFPQYTSRLSSYITDIANGKNDGKLDPLIVDEFYFNYDSWDDITTHLNRIGLNLKSMNNRMNEINNVKNDLKHKFETENYNKEFAKNALNELKEKGKMINNQLIESSRTSIIGALRICVLAFRVLNDMKDQEDEV